MADASIDSLSLILYDNWPRCPSQLESIPTDGFLGASHHNVATAAYNAGTKCYYWNAGDGADLGVAGWATFIYLKGLSVTSAPPTCAARQAVVGSNAENLYQVTNCPTRALLATGASLGAYMLSIMTFTHTATRYGWFWCGGICPEVAVPDLGVVGEGGLAFQTDDSVIAGGPLQWQDLTANFIGLGRHDTTLGICGISLVVDA